MTSHESPTPRQVAEQHSRLIAEHENKTDRVIRHRVETFSYIKAINNIASAVAKSEADREAAFQKLFLYEPADPNMGLGNDSMIGSGWAISDSVDSFLESESRKIEQPNWRGGFMSDEAWAKASKLDDIRTKYALGGEKGILDEEVAGYLMERLPELGAFMTERLQEIQNRGFEISTGEELSSLKVRNYAERNIGALRVAALAEAALDGVQINTDNAINLGK